MDRPGRHALHAPGHWRAGNALRLLENGEEFFPCVFEAIANAQREVLLETFILFEDAVGVQLQQHLVEAARRGVHVEVTVDGYGSPSFTPAFIAALTDAGVKFHVFDPRPKLFGVRLNLFRRMHRKIIVIDGVRAFIGGINFSVEHLCDYGPKALQDYAVELRGPVLRDVHAFALVQLGRNRPTLPHPDPVGDTCGTADVAFVQRDNLYCRTDIELHYRAMIRAARRSVIIANAYFFPSHRLLLEIRRAARRGIDVTLILQGEPDERIAMLGARALYSHLIRAGVQVFEYGLRPFHGKVALVDDEWATIGSSNLDPLSLSLNLEANVFVRDTAFNAALRERLDALKHAHCRRITLDTLPHGMLWQALTGPIAFHILRRFPLWAGLLPAHRSAGLLMQTPDPARPRP